MKSWKLAPGDKNAANYIDCYWLLERKKSDQGYEYPKFNPDPAAHPHLACPQQRYRYSQDDVSFGGMGSHWIAPHCKTVTMDHSQAFLVLGIKFHVGARYSLNLHSSKAALGSVVDVDFNHLIESTAFDRQGFLAKALHSAEYCCDQLDFWPIYCPIVIKINTQS